VQPLQPRALLQRGPRLPALPRERPQVLQEQLPLRGRLQLAQRRPALWRRLQTEPPQSGGEDKSRQPVHSKEFHVFIPWS